VCGLTGGESVLASTFEVRAPEPAVTARTLARLEAMGEEAAAAQKVWVYFTDKNVFDATSYRARLAEVASLLDEHAAARRLKSLGPDLVDHHDIPVHAGYSSELERSGATILRESRWLNAVSVRAPLSSLSSIAGLPFVRKLTLVRAGRSSRLPEPGLTGEEQPIARGASKLLDYGPSFGQLDEINIVAAHGLGLSGAGVRISMMDTGYWRDHPTFERLLIEGRILDQWDFVNNDPETMDEPGDPEGQHNHGTSTFSVVGGFTEGELIGAAYGADFLLAKTEDVSQEHPVEEDNWAAAAEWADNLGADVISSSLGYIEWYEYPDMNGNTAVITIAADIAVGRGIVVSTAAGNWGTQDWFYIGAPADGDSVIAVGATEPDGSMWLDSSHGPTFDGRTKPEVCARGSMTHSGVVPGGHGGPLLYRDLDGTSMSTPLVAGAVALILEAHPQWTPMMVREALKMTADRAQNPDNHRGWGRIDVTAALNVTTGLSARPLAISHPRLVAAPNPSRRSVRLEFDLPAAVVGRPARIEIFSSLGRLVRDLELPAAARSVRWDGLDADGQPAPSGVYLARWSAGDSEATSKVILSR
jgi:subtilisin family serine protease